MSKNLAKLPSVFSLQRLAIVSDGAFFNKMPSGELTPLYVYRHGIRGTLGTEQKTEKNVANVAIPQHTDVAKTHQDAEAVVVEFSLRMIDLDHAVFSCAADTVENTKLVRDNVNGFIERAKTSKGLEEVACRIARNIANGSWLWRNRVVAQDVNVEVFADKKSIASFDALNVPLNVFDNYSAGEKAIAAVVVQGFNGERRANLIVRATIDFGVRGAVEVFPSQAYLEDKPTGFARPLYRLPLSNLPQSQDTDTMYPIGQAAFRDQKISNRLRTIDTWYKDFDATLQAIPIEPNGASLDHQRLFRSSKGDGDTGFDVLKRIGTMDPDSTDGMYTIGILLRGGVYSTSDRVEKAAKEKAAKGKKGEVVADAAETASLETPESVKA